MLQQKLRAESRWVWSAINKKLFSEQLCAALSSSRAAFLQRKSLELMDNDDLQKLWSLLEEKYTPPLVGEDQVPPTQLITHAHTPTHWSSPHTDDQLH